MSTKSKVEVPTMASVADVLIKKHYKEWSTSRLDKRVDAVINKVLRKNSSASVAALSPLAAARLADKVTARGRRIADDIVDKIEAEEDEFLHSQLKTPLEREGVCWDLWCVVITHAYAAVHRVLKSMGVHARESFDEAVNMILTEEMSTAQAEFEDNHEPGHADFVEYARHIRTLASLVHDLHAINSLEGPLASVTRKAALCCTDDDEDEEEEEEATPALKKKKV